MSRVRYVPELFLGLLSLAIAAVWIATIFSSTIHDAKHPNDTIVITGSARKPIDSDLVQWSLSVDGAARTPIAAARRLKVESAAVAPRFSSRASAASWATCGRARSACTRSRRATRPT